jgi:hypothetical protein
MKYVLLIYNAKDFDPKALSEAEYKELIAQYAALGGTPNLKLGQPCGLPKDAVTVRVQNGETIATPGPSGELWVGAYLEFEAGSLEEAVQLAARIPAARKGGAVEVRPAKKYW